MKRGGSELRDSVAGLLSIKFSTVETEKRLAATTADVFYIDDNSSFPLRIAVECKDWAAPLSSSDLASIYNLYKPSLDSREIDRLLLVSRHELGMQPTETLKNFAVVAHKQFDAFVHSLMNFSLLMQSNIAAFENHESYNNFIHPRVEGSSTKLIDSVMHWLSSKNNPVCMVYGGYGLGKTSFSHYLASSLTQKYRDNEFSRIPVRLPLGGLFTKQDLKALVCAELTGAEGQPAVGNFTYELFLQMVRSGVIFLILDGFDEMRHAMSIEDFAYTFEQMSPLFQGESKAIILGRPDAFFDQSEEMDVINSLLSSTGVASDQMPKFEVDRFARDEVDQYIENFCSQRTLSPEELALVKNLKDKEYEVLSRPVQANMFTKILSTLSKRRRTVLTRYELYLEFVRRFVVREESKPARSLVKESGIVELGYSDPRSIFMQNIAWWVSTVHRDNRFLPTDIPITLLPREIRGNRDSTTAVREALVGSIAEHVSRHKGAGLVGKKGANYYYFPHKSYIEFLVSQYFCRAEFSKEMYRTFFSFANPEMISFVGEGPNIGAQNVARGLEHVLGNVSGELVKIAAGSQPFETVLKSRSFAKLSVSEIYLAYEYFLQRGKRDEIENLLLTTINSSRSQKTSSTALRLCCDYIIRFRSLEFVCRLVANAFMGLNPVDLQNLVRDIGNERYFNANFIHRFVLGKCVERVSTDVWRILPVSLSFGAHETAQLGMWCDDYGRPDGVIGKVSPIRFNRSDIEIHLRRPEFQTQLMLVGVYSRSAAGSRK